MTFSDQYKHPKWQRRRLEILERDNFRCQKCGDEETMLHVHHKIYYKNRDVWDYKNYDLVTLCKHCHREIELLKPSKNEFKKIRICKSNGWIGDSLIMFVSNDGTLTMHIYKDNDGDMLVGYNFNSGLDMIRGIVNYTLKNEY